MQLWYVVLHEINKRYHLIESGIIPWRIQKPILHEHICIARQENGKKLTWLPLVCLFKQISGLRIEIM